MPFVHAHAYTVWGTIFASKHSSMTVDAAVLGAGGPIGKLCVEQLLNAGRSVRAVVRNPDKYRDSLPADPQLQVVKGDVTDASSLDPALEGAKGIIFAAAGPSYFGARAVENEVRS